MKINKHLLAQMRKASRAMLKKSPVDPAAIVQEAMKQVAAFQRTMPTAGQDAQPGMKDINPPPQSAARQSAQEDSSAGAREHGAGQGANPGVNPGVPDMLANLQRSMEAMREQFGGLGGGLGSGLGGQTAPVASWPGSFTEGSHTTAGGTRHYKLYVPSSYQGSAGLPAPLIVMLHGCTQDPDDFAHGTGMNALAEETGCLVVYPAQSQQANASRCWNWFNESDQRRDQGEPAIIAGITRAIMETHTVDPGQVYVAGLSAGGAMAIIMGTLYPELYAAVGVHSGLPFASAKDLPTALAAMKGDFRRGHAPKRSLPIIVFHGDRDTTVHPANGEELVARGRAGKKPRTAVEPGQVPNGHAYTRTMHHHDDGSVQAEHWVIHGAGHAWSGGNARGSYTDGRGPDASREMLRFFRTQR